MANIQTQTFIACLSEHDAREDYHGRLSMWRTFASGTTGVAVIFQLPDPYSSPGLRAMMVPAAYFTEDHINTELNSVIDSISARKDVLKTFTPELLLAYFYVMLLTLTVSQKHPGFHEEREWRLVYAPDQFPSDHLRRDTKTIHGIPQIIYELPLIDSPDKSVKIDLVRLLDRVIIGPSQYPNAVGDALVKELTAIGVADARTKVFISGIPLRN